MNKALSKVTMFVLGVRCPVCQSINVERWDKARKQVANAIKGFENHLGQKKLLNSFEQKEKNGDYRSGVGGTAKKEYFCYSCYTSFRKVVDVSYEIF